jgi:uncharacterized protein YbjT (DUF2867 family)
MMKIVVVGGTGLIGSKTLEKLRKRGHEPLAAAPDTGVDLVTGKGLARALAGAEVVIDVSNSPSFDERSATDFFETAGRHLAEAERDAGVAHHLALSVVGTDRLQESGYFRAKLAQETLIRASGVPYTLVHATQFFEFIRTIADISTIGGAVHLPPVKFQPIAAEDVASMITDAALGRPANAMIEIAGPQVFSLVGAVQKVLEFDEDPRGVVSDPDASYYGAPLEEETLVPASGARLGSTTLDWWLAHVPAPRKVAAAERAPETVH